jgi:hypothetical protein
LIFDCAQHTFPIIAEAHLGLAKTNGVFALTNAIELFQVLLVDTLFQRSILWLLAHIEPASEAQNPAVNIPGLENKSQWL